MAKDTIQINVRIRDTERFRLILWELEQLWGRMRIVGSPFADELERILERNLEGGDDEKGAT
mgnify:FL=1